LVFYLFPCFELFSEDLEQNETSFIRSISFSLGSSKGNFSVPSVRPINRSYLDAFVSDSEFVPQYYNIVPFFPSDTILSSSSNQLSVQAETSILDLFYFGFGLGYKSWTRNSDSNQLIQERNNFQYLFFRNLSNLNRIRIAALTADSFNVLNDAYWLNLNLRFPIDLGIPYMEPYLNLEAGAGSCIIGESCNLTRYAAGFGLEWQSLSHNYRPFIYLQTESIHQERPRASYIIRENGFQLGIRFYKF
jgi:hypothetical protein